MTRLVPFDDGCPPSVFREDQRGRHRRITPSDYAALAECLTRLTPQQRKKIAHEWAATYGRDVDTWKGHIRKAKKHLKGGEDDADLTDESYALAFGDGYTDYVDEQDKAEKAYDYLLGRDLRGGDREGCSSALTPETAARCIKSARADYDRLSRNGVSEERLFEAATRTVLAYYVQHVVSDPEALEADGTISHSALVRCVDPFGLRPTRGRMRSVDVVTKGLSDGSLHLPSRP